MTNIEKIRLILTDSLAATVVEIKDQSHLHQHHSGKKHAPPDSGHYDAVIVSPQFRGLRLMQQHRLVYDCLKTEMQTIIHALALKTYTPEQWAEQQGIK
ncbi:MAG: BolA family protein [Pseudanabaenaceae cyanobacterium]|jgi:stress-induced morphogen